MNKNEVRSFGTTLPYAMLLLKVLKLDEKKTNSVYRKHLLEWINYCSEESVIATLDAVLKRIRIDMKVVRALAGLDGPVLKIETLAEMHELEKWWIQSYYTSRKLRERILKSLPKQFPPKKELPPLPPLTPEQRAYLATSVELMGVSMQTARSLQKSGIMTIGDVMYSTSKELLAVMFFGRGVLEDVRQFLALRGLRLRDMEMAQLRHTAPIQKELDAVLAEELTWKFSERTRPALRKLGILTWGDLVRRSAKELRAIKGFSSWDLKEAIEHLLRYHLHLRDTEE